MAISKFNKTQSQCPLIIVAIFLLKFVTIKLEFDTTTGRMLWCQKHTAKRLKLFVLLVSFQSFDRLLRVSGKIYLALLKYVVLVDMGGSPGDVSENPVT